jgi:hypothetical protein
MGFFGSSGSPDTIKTLRPGEQIVIRAGGSLKAFGLDESEAFISSLPRKLVLRARIVFISGGTAHAALTFNTPLFRNPVPVISDNSVSVQVQGPRKP